jgi:hypothetical protein
MWEYATVVVRGQDFNTLSDELREWGVQHWEAVGITPVNWVNGSPGALAYPLVGVLLKRQVGAKTPHSMTR